MEENKPNFNEVLADALAAEKAIKEDKKNVVSYMLFDELCNIYCYNCEGNEKEEFSEEFCENCHRKYMNWRLSRKAADSLAERIDKIYKEY